MKEAEQHTLHMCYPSDGPVSVLNHILGVHSVYKLCTVLLVIVIFPKWDMKPIRTMSIDLIVKIV